MPRTAWHVPFAALIEERAPSDVEVRAEVPLTNEPQRVDLLLLRKKRAGPHTQPRVLLRLWDLFPLDALVEFKSLARPCRKGDVVRLLGYGAQYHVSQYDRLAGQQSLTLVMIVVALNSALTADVERMGWTLADLGGGYRRATAATIRC